MSEPEVRALIERLNEYVKQWEDFDHGTWPECRAMRDAAAALESLLAENARLTQLMVDDGLRLMTQNQQSHNAMLKAEAERDALQGECERLSDAARLAIIDLAARLATIDLAAVAELQRDSRRLHWLHSQASCKPDIQGCEWGIWRVSWEGGRASHVWATNSDFSDLDAAMKLAEDYAAIDAAREKP